MQFDTNVAYRYRSKISKQYRYILLKKNDTKIKRSWFTTSIRNLKFLNQTKQFTTSKYLRHKQKICIVIGVVSCRGAASGSHPARWYATVAGPLAAPRQKTATVALHAQSSVLFDATGDIN